MTRQRTSTSSKDSDSTRRGSIEFTLLMLRMLHPCATPFAARWRSLGISRVAQQKIAAMLAKNLQRDVAIRYSGARRAGDPFSLLADDTALLQLPFDWRISLEQGIVDYVTWFKDHVRD